MRIFDFLKKKKGAQEPAKAEPVKAAPAPQQKRTPTVKPPTGAEIEAAQRARIAELQRQAEANRNAAAQPSMYTSMLKVGVEYAMQYNGETDQYLLEVHDSTGVYLPAGPGAHLEFALGRVYYAVFALTEAEYDLRSRIRSGDTNPAVNELVSGLLANLPKDRLLEMGYIDFGKRETTPLVTNCDTMDNNAYRKIRVAREGAAHRREAPAAVKAKEEPAAAEAEKAPDAVTAEEEPAKAEAASREEPSGDDSIAYLRSLSRLYCVYQRAVSDRFPAVDGQGYAWVCDSEEGAVALVQKNLGMDLAYRAYTQEEFAAFVRGWYALGVTRIRLNPLGPGRSAEISRDDYLPDPKAKKWEYYGSSLNQLILRFRQNRTILDNPDAAAATRTYWDGICHVLPDTPLLVPVVFDGDAPETEDRELHLTAQAAAQLARLELERETGVDLDSATARAVQNPQLKPEDAELFFGGEGYAFAGGVQGRTMHLRTIVGGGQTMLCAFTDFNSLNAIFQGKGRVGVWSFDDIVARLDDAVEGSPAGIQGIVINPGGNMLLLGRKDIETVNARRGEPARIYLHQSESGPTA